MIEQRKENHRLFLTIQSDKIRVEGVLCRVYLPLKLTDPINLLFSPTDEQMKLLENIFEFSITGEVKGFSGEVEVRIQSNKAYTHHSSSKYWGIDIKDNVITAVPEDLKLTKFRRKRDEGSVHKIIGSFWITPSIMLSPRKSIKQSYKGDVNIETDSQCKFSLVNGLPLVFDYHYKFMENKDGDTVTHEELVAEFETETLVQEIENAEDDLIYHLDDFLILVSFAERNRNVCLGWDIVTPQSHVTYYRRNVVIPQGKKKSYEETLIDIIVFEEFIKQAYNSFIMVESRELIRQAIQYVVSTHDTEKTLENSFLTLYSALESLLLHFRREEKSETVFDPSSGEWNEFQKNLMKWVRNYPVLRHFKNKRKLIYEKLPELNRISFATAFEQFCRFYSIDINDLWPVIDNSKGITLSEIRNKLIHGDHFNFSEMRALMSAKENLHWILERIVLSVLGWPISKSKVNGHYLGHYMACYKEWKEDRDLLSQNNCT